MPTFMMMKTNITLDLTNYFATWQSVRSIFDNNTSLLSIFTFFTYSEHIQPWQY